MTRLSDMEAIAGVAVDLIALTTQRLNAVFGRDPTLGEVSEGLAIAYGAARGALAATGTSEADMATLTSFVDLAAADAQFCMQGLREAGL